MSSQPISGLLVILCVGLWFHQTKVIEAEKLGALMEEKITEIENDSDSDINFISESSLSKSKLSEGILES
jgi:hypothetical protein